MSSVAARGSLVLSLVLASSLARAQAPASPPAQAPAAPAPAAAGAAAPASQPGDAPADKPAEPKKPARDAGGYSYSDKPSAAPRRARVAPKRHTGPVATLPGFEQLADGGSRVFVQLSAPVQVEERKAQGSLTYVLKGAHVQFHNNTNALVTVHFDTPVSRARLVPSGEGLLLQIDLRGATQPTWKVTEAQDKTAMLSVEFPKGSYLANGPGDDPAATEAAARGAGSKPAPPPKKAGAKAPAGKGGAPPAKPAPTPGPTP